MYAHTYVHMYIRHVVFTGIILAFNVTSTKVTSKLALQKEVTIISHNVIYKLLELLKVRVYHVFVM